VAFTQSDVTALERAIADGRGARTISFFDQSITFNSIEEMLELLAVMRQDVAGTTGAARNYRLASFRKGV
jgi:hypothetical protein